MSRFTIDMVGKTLDGRFRVGKELARGGMANVYEGHDLQLDHPVVIKVPLPEVLMMDGFRERFAHEVRGLVTLRHPHVVRVLAQGEDDEIPYLVLDMLDGGSLNKRIKRAPNQRLGVDDLRDWLPDVAKTLDFVNSQDVIHRDVKPGNILFDKHGHVFLSDFGIAKAVGRTQLSHTSTGIPLGSPPYMAPEQAGGAGALDGRADQYGLAATLYYALSGQMPFEGETPLQIVVEKQLRVPPNLTDTTSGGVPRHVADAIARGLATKPSDRFASCKDLAAAVLRTPAIVDDRGETVLARPPEPIHEEVSVTKTPPSKLPLVLAGLAALALAGGAFAFLGGKDDERSTTSAATRPPDADPTADPDDRTPQPRRTTPAVPKQDTDAQARADAARQQAAKEQAEREREAERGRETERLAEQQRQDQERKKKLEAARDRATTARTRFNKAQAGWTALWDETLEIEAPSAVGIARANAARATTAWGQDDFATAEQAWGSAADGFETGEAQYRERMKGAARAALVRATHAWTALVQTRDAAGGQVAEAAREAERQQDALGNALKDALAGNSFAPDEYGTLMRARQRQRRAQAEAQFFAGDAWRTVERVDPKAEGAVLKELMESSTTPKLIRRVMDLASKVAALRAQHLERSEKLERVFQIDDEGRTTLHAAVVGKQLDRVKELLAAGLDPNLCDEDGMSALHYAAWDGGVEVVRALLDAGGRPDDRAFQSLTEDEPLGFHHCALKGPNALHLAAYNGNDDAALLFLERGANLGAVAEFKSEPKGG